MSTTNDTTSEHSTATVGDVHGIIATDLGENAITRALEDAWYEARSVNDLDAMDDVDVRQLEKYLTAYNIRATLDRDVQQGSRKSVSLTYDGSSLDELRQKVRRRDPSGELPGDPNVIRRESDHVGSAHPHSRDGIGDRGSRRVRR